MKYKLINRITGEEHLCEKVVIDGWDYYVSDEKINIATNNPNIDIPKVVNEVEKLAFDCYEQVKKEYYSIGQKAELPKSSKEFQAMGDGFIEGYNKSQETHPFSEEDMIDFATFRNGGNVKEEFNLWKEQRNKTLYYE